ncbi:MAG: PD-(D/E)XK nuclease family protein, partial [Candidatus Diapherotrites archaeon]|nr:PD-(D/E)XK nuclease family protein [Candidatus Diapherotrites archaeon]
MTLYSHSRLSSFEQCPQKFKFAYIDGLERDEETIEAFMGSRVHETLEKLYQDLRFQKLNSLEELLGFYNSEWEKNWNENVKIVRADYSKENFREMGQKYLSGYYETHKPFDASKTIALEERVLVSISDGSGTIHKLQGYIDRLAYLGNGFYEIHDYKTAFSLP